MCLDLVDDESVQDHVLRIINNQQYTGVLTFAALSTVIRQPIESIYPGVNDNDEYCEILNTVFIPRNKQLSSLERPLRIMWSGPEKEVDQIWRPNHFTPVLSTSQSNSVIETTAAFESVDDNITYVESAEVPSQTVLRTSKSKITYTSEERAHSTVREKKIDKNKFNDRRKLSVAFDRAMSNVYENSIFPTLPCDMVEIHNIIS